MRFDARQIDAGADPNAPPIRKLDLDAAVGGARLIGALIDALRRGRRKRNRKKCRPRRRLRIP